MGLFYVSGRLTGPTGLSEAVDLLVDTGATLLVVPRDLAERLGLSVLRTQRVQVAGGAKEDWPVSHVWVQIEAREVPTACFIASAGPPLLGAVALESLFLAVDPVARRLIPAEGFIGATPYGAPMASGVAAGR